MRLDIIVLLLAAVFASGVAIQQARDAVEMRAARNAELVCESVGACGAKCIEKTQPDN